jgi:signal transduction histidine kinase
VVPKVPMSAEPSPLEEDTVPELSVRVVGVVVLYFEKTYGPDRLRALWEREHVSLPLEYLHTHSNFVSMRFAERLTRALVADSGDSDFIRYAMQMTATPDALGFTYHLMKALGSPGLCYRKAVEMSHVFNRVGRFSVEVLGDDNMTLSYWSSVPESDRNFCIGRQAQFATFPTIWGLPLAEVKETHCQLDGAPACRYVMKWHNPRRRWRRWAFGVGSAAAGAGLWHVFPGAGPPLLALSTGAGVALGAYLDERREVLRASELLASQTEGLLRSMEDLQRRSDEVHRANVLLEERVAQRTRELEQSAQMLGKALEQQRELDRLKTQFFDNVSHELRTPLTLILLSLESLLSHGTAALSPDVRQDLETMERSATKLLRLIDQLLDLAKMEAGKTRLRYQPVELSSFLRTMLGPFRVLAQERAIALRVEGGPMTSVHVDPDQMEGVFQNLLSNALKFTLRGSVTVRLSETPDEVAVEVSDTGCGMSPEDLPRIFDRFAQADSTGIRRLHGTGIGLALVKETVELHAGHIEVSSLLDVGSTFRVTLPKGTAHIREDLRERVDPEEAQQRERRRGPPELSQALRRLQAAPEVSSAPDSPLPPAQPQPQAQVQAQRTVLVVEDDDEIRRFIAGFLRTDGFRVLEASNGEEGIARAKAGYPDVVVSDVMMPVMSGVQMVQALRADPETADLPVILLTARNETDATLYGLGAGANDYVGKPFRPRELVARVETQLRLRDAAARVAENERLATLGLLTTGFAHEVRNPLNGLLNSLGPLRELLVPGGDFSTAETLLSVLEEAGERIHYLAESLLGFARPTDRREAVDVCASLDGTLKVMAWRTPPGIKVERNYQAREGVLGEAGALNQVWLNLVDNALRAMNETGTLKLETRVVGEELMVAVSDTGEGIHPRHIAHLFQPFFSTRRAGEGTGLGLTLSRRIVLRHGGRMEVSTEEGRGSTFSVFLPLHLRAELPEGRLAPSVRASA